MAMNPSDATKLVERAKTTDYQNNGGLNALVHVLVPKMGDIIRKAPQPVGVVDLCNAFKEIYGFEVTQQELTKLLEGIQDPVQREVVLGPVLRSMVDNEDARANKLVADPVTGIWPEPTANEVRKVANKFDIKVEWYATGDFTKADIRKYLTSPQWNGIANPDYKAEYLNPDAQAQLSAKIDDLYTNVVLKDPDHLAHPKFDRFRKIDQSKCTVGTLKLVNDGMGNQCEYVADPKQVEEHNKAYKGRKPYDYNTDHVAIRTKILDERIRLRNNWALKLNLKNTLNEYEAETGKARTEEEKTQNFMEEAMAKIMSLFSLGVEGKDNPFGGIGQIFAKIIGVIFSIVPMFKKMGEAFKEQKRDTDPLDKEELKKMSDENPALGRAAAEFTELNELLEAKGGKAASIAASLNAEWRKDPNTPDIWEKLLTNMADNELLWEADQYLKAQEDRLLQELGKIATLVPGGKCQELLDKYKDALDKERDPVLSYSLEGDKTKEIFKNRLTQFMEVSGGMASLIAENRERLNLVAQGIKLSQSKKDLEDDVALPSNGALAPELQARLNHVKEALKRTLTGIQDTAQSVRDHDRAIAEPVSKAFSVMFDRAKQDALQAVTDQAKTAKVEAETIRKEKAQAEKDELAHQRALELAQIARAGVH